MNLKRAKAQAKQYYLERERLLDRVDCGASILRLVSPEFKNADDKFNEAILLCEQLDPNFPKAKVGEKIG